jgi:hypothetical protein
MALGFGRERKRRKFSTVSVHKLVENTWNGALTP